MTQEIDAAILSSLFSSQGYVSGERIASQLDLTRTAVWKRIVRLREMGCTISSYPRLGYRLVALPDKLLPQFITVGLNTSLIAREVNYYHEIDSTNLQAKKLAARGVKDGTAVVTEFQTSGQGRLKRTWVSPPGKNLLFSIIFYPPLRPAEVFRLTLLSSLAVCKSVIATANLQAGIKWPNDIYVKNRKISGVLTEFSANPDRVLWAVVGIGINVNFDPSGDPHLADIATSIKRETGKEQQRLPLLRAILEEMDRGYQQLLSGQGKEIREEWLAHSIVLGRPVVIFSDDRGEEGIAESIDENGALILRKSNGETRPVFYGDLSLRVQESEFRSQ